MLDCQRSLSIDSSFHIFHISLVKYAEAADLIRNDNDMLDRSLISRARLSLERNGEGVFGVYLVTVLVGNG